jgi:hypothetical protein
MADNGNTARDTARDTGRDTLGDALAGAHLPDVRVRDHRVRDGRVTSPRPPRTTGPGTDRPYNIATADGRAAIRAAGERGLTGAAPDLAALVVVLSDALERAIEAAHPVRHLTAIRDAREHLRPLFPDGAGTPEERRMLRHRLEASAVAYVAGARPDAAYRVYSRIAALALVDLEALEDPSAPPGPATHSDPSPPVTHEP